VNLINEIEKALPIYAYPTNNLLKSIDKKYKLKLNSMLEITSVMDGGNEGGIMCGIQVDKQVVLTSITHLNFKDEHVLKDKINTYKRERINLLKSEDIVRNISIGRNEPCPCGSGKKYKKCCMN
jgi:uncharacterized protein YchJ